MKFYNLTTNDILPFYFVVVNNGKFSICLSSAKRYYKRYLRNYRFKSFFTKLFNLFRNNKKKKPIAEKLSFYNVFCKFYY